MPAVSRVGDQGSHSGTSIGNITTGNSTVLTNGMATAYVGSGYYCPQHGQNSIVSSLATKTIAGGQTIAVVGSTTACGAVIFQGSPTVNAG